MAVFGRYLLESKTCMGGKTKKPLSQPRGSGHVSGSRSIAVRRDEVCAARKKDDVQGVDDSRPPPAITSFVNSRSNRPCLSG